MRLSMYGFDAKAKCKVIGKNRSRRSPFLIFTVLMCRAKIVKTKVFKKGKAGNIFIDRLIPYGSNKQ